jgi:hypothetical protein
VESFDAADLRLRVRGAFSGAELRRLLEAWGAKAEELGGSQTELAHQVVKLGCKVHGLSELLRKLSNEKPLVEWPEVPNDDERWAGPMSLNVEAPPASLAVPTEAGEALEPTLGVPLESPPNDEAAPSAQPPAATPAPPVVEPAPPSLRQPAPYAFEPSPPVSAGPPWKLLAILGGVIGLVGVAFAVGTLVASSRDKQATTAVEQTPARPRGKTAAGRAASLLEGALTALGNLCEVEVEGAPTVEVLELSLEACGRDEVDKLRRQQERQMLESRQDDRDRPDPSVPSARPLPPRPGFAPPAPGRTTNPSAPKAGCRGACNSSRGECQTSCGREPSDASRYAPYQACISHCVAEESRCRLACR